MITCPHCKKEKELKYWWRKHRLPKLKKIESALCEYQTKYVANNIGVGVEVTNTPEYKQSEKKIQQVWRLIELINP